MARTGNFDENYFFNFTSTDAGCYITQMGRALPNPAYVQRKRILARHLFDYVTSGRGWVECGGKRYEVTAGDIIYYRKGICVDYGASPDEPYEKLWLAADGRMVDALTEQYLVGQDIAILHGEPDTLFTKMKNVLTVHGHDEARILHIMTDLVLTLSALPKGRFGTDDPRGLSEQIRQYVDDHLASSLSLDDLSEHFHISRRHLIRRFKDSFGKSPGAYHTELRLQAAARYLAETALPVGEVAELLGYTDRAYFSSAFKKRFSKSPVQYRAENE